MLFFAVWPVVLSSYGWGRGRGGILVLLLDIKNQFTGRHVCRDVERESWRLMLIVERERAGG